VELEALRDRAVAVAELYDRYHLAAGREAWSRADLALGFVGDVGDLAKLVLALDGRREIAGARGLLGHELADCLWSILVLADRFDVDLAAEFGRMTDEVERHLRGQDRS